MSTPPVHEGEEYTCARCGKTFTSDWTDAEAMAELEANMKPVPDDPLEVVCDHCYTEFMAWARSEAPELLR